jgi:cell division protein FtsI/penicillin-binding protein 2
MTDFQRDYEEELYRYLPKAEPLTIQREWMVAPASLVALLLLLTSLFITGVVRFPFYQAQAAQNRVARIALSPSRGEILDRKGRPLAVNHLVYDCYFITSDDIETDLADLSALGGFLELQPTALDALIQSRRAAPQSRSLESELWAAGKGEFGARSIIVKRDLNGVEVTALVERSDQFPRAFIEQAYRRSYPAGSSAAQVVGYMGEISEGTLNELTPLGYRIGDIVGKAGLEKQYDNILRGRPGERLVAVDAKGRILGEAETVPAVVPEDGAVVVRGDEVAMLRNGDVVDFTRGARISLLNGIVEVTEIGVSRVAGAEVSGRRTVFRDTGSGGQYGEWNVFRNPGEVAMLDGDVVLRPSVKPPSSGSTLHTTIDLDMQRTIDGILGDTVGGVIAMDPRDGSILAIVSEPAFDPNLFAPGGVDVTGWQAIMDDPNRPMLDRPVQNAYVPGSTFKLVTALAGWEKGVIGPGSTWTCTGSLEVGDRVFHCWNRGGHGTLDFVGAMANSCDSAFWQMGEALGHDSIADMARMLGMGQTLGIDLPDEKRGLIPDDAWKRQRFDQRWFLGDTMNMAIGQGFVQCTVLQIARITATVANGGLLVPPHLNTLLNPAPSTLERIPVEPEGIAQIRVGMRAVISQGTAKSCNLDWIRICGKTGTADDPPRKDPHSWFTSFGPYENPFLVITVFCENGGHADIKAAPLTRRIWESPAVRAYLADQGYAAAAPSTPAAPSASENN